MLNYAGLAVEHHQPGSIAWLHRFLGDKLLGQVKIEISSSHEEAFRGRDQEFSTVKQSGSDIDGNGKDDREQDRRCQREDDR